MSAPKLRFKEDDGSALPAWMEHSLGDIFSERVERSNGTEELLAVTIANGVTKQSESARRNVAADDTSNYKVVHINDLAYNTMRMWQGAEGVSDYDGIISPAYTVVICNDNNLAKFFEIMFKRTPMLQKFERYSQGLTSDTWNLKYKNFSKIKTFIPSLREQQKIVELFSSLDKVIQDCQSEIDVWEKYKRGVMQKLFSQKVRFKAEDGSDFPDWQEVEFSKVFTKLNNNTFSRDCLNNSNGTYKNIHYGDVLIKYGTILDVSKANIPYVNDDINCNKYDLLRDGDVVVADTAEDETVGKSVEVSNAGNTSIISGLHTMAWRPIIDFAPMYLGYYINSTIYHKQLYPCMQGIKVTSINKSDIGSTTILYPSYQEQQKIADCLFAFDDVINKAKQKLEAYKRLKQGLLQQIFV